MSRHDENFTAACGATPVDDAAFDEACFLAELRLSVEGARTAAEDRLLRRHPGWSERMGEVCARLAG